MPTTNLWTRAETRPVDFETGWLVGIDENSSGVRCAYPSETMQRRQARRYFSLKPGWIAKDGILKFALWRCREDSRTPMSWPRCTP